MDMAGKKLIPESRENVWKALNDPEILRNCVPGCKSLEKTSETEMVATAAIRVGPVSAKFNGSISLSELNEPKSYRITGEGQGGVAGFARGSAFIRLEEVEGGTMLTYDVDAQVGGKLAQLGGRLIDATARKMAEAFFEKFAAEIRRQYHDEGDAAQPAAQAAALSETKASGQSSAPSPPVPAPAPAAGGGSRIVTLVALALAVLFAFLWLTGLQGGAPAVGPSQALSPEFGAAVQIIQIAAIGYLFGRLSDRRQ